MTPLTSTSWACRLSLVAGALDTCTGLGLVFFPGLVLPLMRVPLPTGDGWVFLRFVGAFVAAVGMTYLWALCAPRERLRVVLGATVIFRLAAGGYSLAAVVGGQLGLAWASVPATDLALVIAQLWLLSKGAGRHE
ncbi:MAG: hypothetical protein JNJ82_12070 [Opitutaceae bacterium]|jgi:hypothetical protein|nr:hypothetical protein [Opitutaceae bacterium]